MTTPDPDEELARFRAAVESARKVLEAMEKAIPTFRDPSLRAAVQTKRDELKREYEGMLGDLANLDAIDSAGRLRGRKQGRSVNKMNAQAHALATSGGKSDDALVQVANRHGYTLRRLAKEAGVSATLLSRARRGDRTLKRSVADKIEALIGFKATTVNWPGGLT